MLDTRYIHLHEALGLGAMWLKNTAKILAPTAVSGSLKPPSSTHNHTSSSRQNNDAHQQMLVWLQQNNPNAPTESPKQTKPILSCQNGLPAMFSGSVAPAKLLVLGFEPSPNDFVMQQLFSGEEGVLLHKMLAAIGLQPQQVHLSCWLKTRRSLSVPSRDELFQAAECVRQEWQQTQAQAMLLLGEDKFQRPDLQQWVKQIVGDAPVFVIPHPSRILTNSSLKRPAWETLKRLQSQVLFGEDGTGG